MKTLLFRLMLLISIAGVGGISAHAKEIIKVVRVNPGDTVSTNLLTSLSDDEYYDNPDRSNLILVKNGGEVIIKIENLDPNSFSCPYGDLTLEGNCIKGSSNKELAPYHFSYKKIGENEERLVIFKVNFYGVPLLIEQKENGDKDTTEIQQDAVIEVEDKDPDKKIFIPKNFRNTWWNVALHKDEAPKQFQMRVYETTIRDLISEAKKVTSESNNVFYFSIEYYDGNGFLVDNPEWPYVDTATSMSTFSIKITSSTGIETINSNTPKETRIYDLQGRRLSKLQKGINIVNGKKVLIR